MFVSWWLCTIDLEILQVQHVWNFNILTLFCETMANKGRKRGWKIDGQTRNCKQTDCSMFELKIVKIVFDLLVWLVISFRTLILNWTQTRRLWTASELVEVNIACSVANCLNSKYFQSSIQNEVFIWLWKWVTELLSRELLAMRSF